MPLKHLCPVFPGLRRVSELQTSANGGEEDARVGCNVGAIGSWWGSRVGKAAAPNLPKFSEPTVEWDVSAKPRSAAPRCWWNRSITFSRTSSPKRCYCRDRPSDRLRQEISRMLPVPSVPWALRRSDVIMRDSNIPRRDGEIAGCVPGPKTQGLRYYMESVDARPYL